MDLYIESLISGNISISGDGGTPNVKLVGPSYTTVPVKDVLGNQQFCEECSTFITNSKIRVRVGNASGRILTAAQMSAIQNGTLFDLDSDGVADMAEGIASIIIQGIDLKDTGTEWSANLPGDGSQKFLPLRATAICRTADALAGDATIDLGTTTGGTEWLGAAALSGLNAVDEAIVKVIDVTTAAIATVDDNAALYVNVAGADSGTAGTIDLKIEGIFL